MNKIWAGLLFGVGAFGALSNCPSTTATSAVNNGVSSPTAPIPGAGPGNDFQTLAGTGCQVTDLAFTNFGGTFAGSGTANHVLTLNGLYFDATPSGNPLVSPTDIVIATVRGTATVSTDGDNNDGQNNWIANSSDVNKAVNDEFSFLVDDQAAGQAVSSIQVVVNQPALATQGGSTGTGTITFNFCLGGTPPSGQITSAANCTGGSTFFQDVVTLTAPGGTTQLATINLPTVSSVFNLTAIVNLSGSGNASAGFDSLGLNFSEVAPEPSTFVLIGTVLLGAGLARLRKRKTA